jgi:site-specific DNA-methyltransferase (adenine-specific)
MPTSSTYTPAPYFDGGDVQLYRGDMRDIIPRLTIAPNCVIADPPYGETSLAWDRWPDSWPASLTGITNSMWCFGSMRMFLERVPQFAAWRMSQDIVWEKHNGSSFAADRFKRVHEFAVHWYRGPWSDVYHYVPRVPRVGPAKAVKNRTSMPHTGAISGGVYLDDGTRLARSVLRHRSVHGRAIHPTEKPIGLLTDLIEYACPVGGLVLDPFAGSGSTAAAARATGRRAVLIEGREDYCEKIAVRLNRAGHHAN